MSRRIKRRKQNVTRTIKRRETGIQRQRKFNRRKRKIIVNTIERRLPIKRAVELAGINYSTYREWMDKGKDKRNPVHRRFRFQVKRAEAKAELEALDIIRKASIGGGKIKETKITVGGKNEGYSKTVKERGPVWQAAAWYLERKWKEDYGRDIPPQDTEKSAEERAQEIKQAADKLFESVPTEDEE